MDIPLPEESQPPGIPEGALPRCDNIPLPSCGIQFNPAIPPPFPPPISVMPPPVILPVQPPKTEPVSKASVENEPADDPNRYSPSRATAEDDVPPSPPPVSLPSEKPEESSYQSRSSTAASKMTVLGKAQAKKRLLAFSMTKQAGGAGVSFGFQKKVTPKVNSNSAKVFAGPTNEEESVQEPKETSVKLEKLPPPVKKKSSKKGTSREHKARAVISAIEEIKREELMLRGAIPNYDPKGFGEMTAPIPLFTPFQIQLKRREELELAALAAAERNPLTEKQRGEVDTMLNSILAQNDKSVSNDKGHSDTEGESSRSRKKKDDHKKDSEKGNRHKSDERRRSKERHSKSGKDRHKDEKKSHSRSELPTSWSQFLEGGYQFEEIRRLKLKLEESHTLSKSSRNRDRHRRRSRDRDRRSRSHEDRRSRRSPGSDKDHRNDEELETLYRPFDGPSQLMFPLLISNAKKLFVEYPRSYIRYTKTRPPLQYCEHPDSFRAQFRTRSEIIRDATSDMVKLMNKIINSRPPDEAVHVKQEHGENLSNSLAALQVTYDEAEVGSSCSQENVPEIKRKERQWFPEKDYLLSMEPVEKLETSNNEAEVSIEQEDTDMEQELVVERKLSLEAMDAEIDYHSPSNIEQDIKKSPEVTSPDLPLQLTERKTVRSRWDSDYEEDMSVEENQLKSDPFVPSMSSEPDYEAEEDRSRNSTKVDFEIDESRNRNREEYENDSETQEENKQLTSEAEEIQKDDSLGNMSYEDEKDLKDTEEEKDKSDEMEIEETPDITNMDPVVEGNTDQKLVSEYEEFMKAVSFDTVATDEQASQSVQQENSPKVGKEPSENEIFERHERDLQLNTTWDEDSKEKIEEREEQVNTDLLLLEKVIRGGREKKRKKKRVSRSDSSSSSSDEDEKVVSKKRVKKTKSKNSSKPKKESRRKSVSSDGSSSSDESSSSTSDNEAEEKKKHLSKKEKGKKKSAATIEDLISEEKPKSKHKKPSKKKKKRKKSRKKKESRKRSKKRKVETSSSSDDSSDSGDSSSDKSERGNKHHKIKETKLIKKDEDSSSEDSSNSSSSSSSSSPDRKKKKKKKKKKTSKRSKKESKKKKKKEKSKKKKKHHHDSTSDEDGNIKSKSSKSSQKRDGNKKLRNGAGSVDLDELQKHIGRSQNEMSGSLEIQGRSLQEDRRELMSDFSNSLNIDPKILQYDKSDVKRQNLQTEEANSSEISWENSEKPKQKRKKLDDSVDADREDEKERMRQIEERKLLKKQRRARRSQSSSPLVDLSRKRRRSPSTSPEHSPTPQRRSSTEGKDKVQKERDVSPKNKNNSGHRLSRNEEGRNKGRSQEDMDLSLKNFTNPPGLKVDSFAEVDKQSGFESSADDSFKDKTKTKKSRHRYESPEGFESSDESSKKRKSTTELASQVENKSDSEVSESSEEESDESEDESISPLLTRVKQEVTSEDEILIKKLRTANDNSQTSHKSSENIKSSARSEFSGHFLFNTSSIDKEIHIKTEKENERPDDSGSIYSPGDPFESRLDDKNVSDLIDSASQNSDFIPKSYRSDMSLASSPQSSTVGSLMAAHDQDSCAHSPPPLENMEVIDQWTGNDSPIHDKALHNLSLDHIPLPPSSHSENHESKVIPLKKKEFDKSSEKVAPPLPPVLPTCINSNISEDMSIQGNVSNVSTFSSPVLESPEGQHKSSNKTNLTDVKLQDVEEPESGIKSDIKNSSNIFEDTDKDTLKERANLDSENIFPDDSSRSRETNKNDQSDSKVQIKHPWKSLGIPLKAESSSAVLYDDLIETSATDQQVSSTTVKAIPAFEQEKSNSGEAVAKEKLRKRPSRWGMMTTPVKPTTEELQQDDAITSQQKQQTETADYPKVREERDIPAYQHLVDTASSEFSSYLDKERYSDTDTSSSHYESRRASRDSEKHSRDDDRRERSRKVEKRETERLRDRDRRKDRSEEKDSSRQVRSESRENDYRRRDDRDKDRMREEVGRIEKNNKNDSSDADLGEQISERRVEYRDYEQRKIESISSVNFPSTHHHSEWEDGGESSHYARQLETDWEVPALTVNPPLETQWESSRTVRYRSRSRSVSPEFRGWDEAYIRREREQNAMRYMHYSDEFRHLEEQDDEDIRESSRDCDRVKEDDREHDRIRDNSRDSRDRIRDEHDQMSTSSRDQDRLREDIRDRNREESRDGDRLREPDVLRESSMDRDRIRESDIVRESSMDHDRIRESDMVRESSRDRFREESRDKSRFRYDSREREGLREVSRERLREDSRDRERLREGRDIDRHRDSRDRDKERESSRERERMRDHDRIRDRPEDRDRRSDRRVHDRWGDDDRDRRDRDRNRNRERDRRSERRWDKDRRDRKRDDRSRDHDRDRVRWNERSRSPLMDNRREHESSSSGFYVHDIPLPVACGGDSWAPSSVVGTRDAEMEVSCSPASSPLVGFKRSLADSTISDSELVAAAGKQEHRPSSPFQHHTGYYNSEHYPDAQYTTREEPSPTISPSFSPKRLSLDDRIELELGVKKSPPPILSAPQQIPVYHQQTYTTASYSGYQGNNYFPIPPPQYEGSDKGVPPHPQYVPPHDEYSGLPPRHHNNQFMMPPPSPATGRHKQPLLPTPSIAPDMSQWDSPEAFIGSRDVHKVIVPPPPHQHPARMTAEGYTAPPPKGSHVVQVGNVLQVVPAEIPPGVIIGGPPPPPPPPPVQKHQKSRVLQAGNMLQVIPTENFPVPDNSGGTQVFQVGNVLQVVPGASPSPATPQHVAKVATAPLPPPLAHQERSPVMSSPIAKASPIARFPLPGVPPPPAPVVGASITVASSSEVYSKKPPLPPLPAPGYSPPASPFVITEQQAVSVKMVPPVLPASVAPAMPDNPVPLPVPVPLVSPGESSADEVERKRAEREQRRQEKEKRRREKDKRRQLKIKLAADNLVKKALKQGEQTDIDIEEMRLIEEAMQQVPEEEDEAAAAEVTPVKKKRRAALPVTPLPPAGKGILVSPGFREKPINVAENEERKTVKFADGVKPGEGTSPSAGEDLPSPPPPPRKMPKEKRFKKKKKKKKIKVKIIRQINVEDDDDEDDDEDTSPPPPPPGSPPPPPAYPPGYPAGYPPGYVYPQPATYTVLPGAQGVEAAAPAPVTVPPAGSATVFTPLYHQHHTTTTTHTTTVQFAPPPPPPVAPAPPPLPSPLVYPSAAKQRKPK